LWVADVWERHPFLAGAADVLVIVVRRDVYNARIGSLLQKVAFLMPVKVKARAFHDA
jgi:hypothetical protein